MTHIAFFNPQGNFDPADSYWTQHPDFGGQLVYVKELALAMAAQGHTVDIVTRRIADPQWREFSAPVDRYPDSPSVRIVRLPCGGNLFLPKELLWGCLAEWVNNIVAFYAREGHPPDFVTTHYGDGGLAGVLFAQKAGVPFSFTGHSLGAQKMDKLHANAKNLPDLDARYHFTERIFAERLAMNHAALIVTSTEQERREQYTHRAYRGAVDPLGADADRFAVIPPGVNRRIFSPEPDANDATIAARLDAAIARDIPPARRKLPLVLVSSRLDQKKNHIGVVRAFAQSASLRAIANLAIVVRGPDDPLHRRNQFPPAERAILDEIAALLDAENLWDAVTSFPLNNQHELAAAYRYAAARRSVFALTAHYEPFGLAPLEAMSCGLPAVVTRNGGPAESLFDAATGKRFGVLVDPADPADIAHGLLTALSPLSAWEKLRDAGIERVVSRYTWARTAAGYLAAIDRVTARPPHSGTMEIPAYFLNPRAENRIPLAKLAAIYDPTH